MVNFEVYAGTASEVENIGTLSANVGLGGSIDFIKKNFNNADKRVVVLAKNKAGESAVISCSEQLSKDLRKQYSEGADRQQLLAGLLAMPIFENEVGNFIGYEGAAGGEGFAVEALAKVKKAAFTVEDIAW